MQTRVTFDEETEACQRLTSSLGEMVSLELDPWIHAILRPKDQTCDGISPEFKHGLANDPFACDPRFGHILKMFQELVELLESAGNSFFVHNGPVTGFESMFFCDFTHRPCDNHQSPSCNWWQSQCSTVFLWAFGSQVRHPNSGVENG